MKKTKSKDHPGWGGRREGSGLKPRGDHPVVTRSIAFDPIFLDRLDKFAKRHKHSRSKALAVLCEDALARDEKKSEKNENPS